jgi:hypothetical protein
MVGTKERWNASATPAKQGSIKVSEFVKQQETEFNAPATAPAPATAVAEKPPRNRNSRKAAGSPQFL